MLVKKVRRTAVGPVRGGRGAFVILNLGRHENDGTIFLGVIEKTTQKRLESARGFAVLSLIMFHESLVVLISDNSFKMISEESP